MALTKVTDGVWVDLDSLVHVNGRFVYLDDGSCEEWSEAEIANLNRILEELEHARNTVAFYYGVPVTRAEMGDPERMRQIRERGQ
jgi:hypothetical protein